jgi:outer membrane protein W
VSLTAGGGTDIAKLKLEYGYPVLPELWAVAQGSLFVSLGQVSAVPAGFGVKYVFGPDHRIRPFAGVLVGVALAEGRAAFHLIATGGVWFVVWRGAGFIVEASADSSTVQRSPEGHTVFAGTATAGFSYAW